MSAAGGMSRTRSSRGFGNVAPGPSPASAKTSSGLSSWFGSSSKSKPKKSDEMVLQLQRLVQELSDQLNDKEEALNQQKSTKELLATRIQQLETELRLARGRQR